MKKLATISTLLLTTQMAFAETCVVPAKFNQKNRDALIVCLKNQIDELNKVAPASEITQPIGDFIVAKVKRATQTKLTEGNKDLRTTAVFVLKNISNQPLDIGAVHGSFHLSDDQGGYANLDYPSGWPYPTYGSDFIIAGTQTTIAPKASVIVTLAARISHTASTQPETINFSGNFYKVNTGGAMEIFGVDFSGIQVSHP